MRFLTLVVVCLTASCASAVGFETVEDAVILDALTQEITAPDEHKIVNLSADVKAELDDVVSASGNGMAKFRALRNHLFDEQGRYIIYDAMATKTAEETYESRAGNCLSMSNLFVAAARYVGIDSHFQTLSVRATWDQEGTTMIRYEHIVAAVCLTTLRPGVTSARPIVALVTQPWQS